MTLQELIAALEKATGPDRKVDAKIYELMIGLNQYESIESDALEGVCLRYYPGPPGPSFSRIARYTASIDAALTLVPETDGKCWYEIGQAWSHATARLRVYPPNPWEGRTREAAADGPTPAIAVCKAALCLRAAA